MEKLHFDVHALESMHRFGDTLADAVEGIESSIAEFETVREAGDCIGRHWYGLRCRAVCKRSSCGFYLHIGLIYLPSTRTGLMIELDERNNKNSYSRVLENIKENPGYEINRVEPEYLKLFMPDAVFTDLSGRGRREQEAILRDFVRNGAEAIVEAAYETGFRLNYSDLANAWNLANAFEDALKEMKSDICNVEANPEDKDNFGQYAQGFRYYLTGSGGCVSLYAYFGAIYSYKKQPAGIFAEIDRYSNPKEFDRVADRIRPSGQYELSTAEDGFLKLFMTEPMTEALNQADPEAQRRMLVEFLKACSEAMVSAWEKGGNH